MTAPPRPHIGRSTDPPTSAGRIHRRWVIGPAVLTGAAAALALTGRTGPAPGQWIAVVGLCAVLCATDLYRRRLPNPVVALAGCAAVVWAVQVPGGPAAAAVGAVAATALYLPGHLRGGIGAGDVKLAAVIGGLTAPHGADTWWIAALSAPLFTLAAAAATALVAGAPTARRIRWPHGVALCAGLLCALALAPSVGR